MTYCLDCRTVSDHFPGIGRYALNLARALVPVLDDGEELLLLRDPRQKSYWDASPLADGRPRILDVPISVFSLHQQWRLPPLLRAARVAAYHSPYYLMPLRPGAPAVLTIYDLIPIRYPRYFAPSTRLMFAVAIRLAARAAHVILATSEAAARDLRGRLRVPAARMAVVPLAADPRFRPPAAAATRAVRERLRLPDRYVLYVGSNRPHKNLARLIDAWARLQPQPSPLVIAGAWDPRYPEARTRAAALGLGTAVQFLGAVTDADLPMVYAGAELFVFPSEYEGFGLPVIEAMACGVPVACGNGGALAEVAGGAAVVFDPLDVEAIAATIGALLADPERRIGLTRQGLERSASFSWERAARLTLAVYRQVKGM